MIPSPSVTCPSEAMTTWPSRRTDTTVVERILLWFCEGFTDLPDTIGTISNYTVQKTRICRFGWVRLPRRCRTNRDPDAIVEMPSVQSKHITGLRVKARYALAGCSSGSQSE